MGSAICFYTSLMSFSRNEWAYLLKFPPKCDRYYSCSTHHALGISLWVPCRCCGDMSKNGSFVCGAAQKTKIIVFHCRTLEHTSLKRAYIVIIHTHMSSTIKTECWISHGAVLLKQKGLSALLKSPTSAAWQCWDSASAHGLRFRWGKPILIASPKKMKLRGCWHLPYAFSATFWWIFKETLY